MNINKLIVDLANKDKGKKELKGNSGWEDKSFENLMKMTGWSIGQSWCAYWAEKVWIEAFEILNPNYVPVLRSLFSANAVHTWKQFSSSKFHTNKIPNEGAVVIWAKFRDGNPVFLTKDHQWIAGHAGIVIAAWDHGFKTLEGNSNESGGREGIEVAEQDRAYNFEENNGLRLLGFIHPV